MGKLHLLSLGLGLSLSLGAMEPGASVEFITLKPFKTVNHSSYGKVLRDIMSHEAPGDFNSYDDKVTLGHETSHGIHAYIRNHLNTSGKRANGFYVLENRAALVIEPPIRKGQIAPYVPTSLRGSRYSSYVTGQTAWDDTPLYIWDEWNAYVNGSETGVDQVQSGLWTGGWRDAVAGTIEFVVYALATAQAVSILAPDYFENYPQFSEFLAWNIERSMKAYTVGALMKQFQWDVQDRYYSAFRTGADAEGLRQFTKEIFGSAWTERVLDF